jgi:phospholipase C
MNPGSNQWIATNDAYNGGLNNMWVEKVAPWAWGFFQKKDLPLHSVFAEEWTVGDMYQVSKPSI